MVDVHTSAQRSRNMAAIKGKNTKLELIIRKELHKLGFRYRLHYSALPGSPDLVFPRYKAVILINGCFWHKHECEIFRWPTTRAEFWRKKIEANAERDQRQQFELKQDYGLRSLVVWGCALTGKTKRPIDDVVKLVGHWLRLEQSDPCYCCSEIRGYR